MEDFDMLHDWVVKRRDDAHSALAQAGNTPRSAKAHLTMIRDCENSLDAIRTTMQAMQAMQAMHDDERKAVATLLATLAP